VNTIGGPERVNHTSWPTDLVAFFHIQTADRLGTGVPKEYDMARGRSRKAPGVLAPSLEFIVKALEHHYREHDVRRGESEALHALGDLAATQVPVL
jgi:hypothetical protein